MEKTLETILSNRKYIKLTEDQKKKLKNLRINNENLLDDRNFLYNLIDAIRLEDFKTIYNILISELDNDNIKRNDIIRKFPEFKDITKKLYMIKSSNLVEEEGQKGLFKCKKCGSQNTINKAEQRRSADEPATEVITCTDCGHVYTIN